MMIPKFWVSVRLIDVCEIGTGNSAPQNKAHFANGKTPFVRMQDVGRTGTNMYVENTVNQVNNDAIRDLHLRVWPEGSLLFPKSGASILLNHRALLHQPSCVVSHLAIIVPSDLILPEYLYYFSLTIDASQLVPDSNYPSLRTSDLGTIRIPLPPLHEQRRIAVIMRQADMLRQWRQDSSKMRNKLLLSLFFTKFGHPNQWDPIIPLGRLVEFVGGGTPSRAINKYFDGDIPWATSKDIKSRYLNDTQEHITDEAIQNSATNLVPAKTILVVVKSKILMHSLPLGITTRPFCFGQDIKGLICKPGVIPQFIVAAMLAQMDRIIRRARGLNTEGLTLEILRSIPIPDIDKNLQQEFLDNVLVYDELEVNSTISYIKTHTLFKSILNRAFIGELTASWREKHKEELQLAAVERDIKLGLRGEVATLKDVEEGRLSPAEEEQIRQVLGQALGQFAVNITKLLEPMRQSTIEASSPLFEMNKNIFEPLLQALRQSRQAAVSFQFPKIPYINSENVLRYIDNLPVKEEKRAIIETLDTTTIRVLKLAGTYSAYFTANDLEAGEYGGITTLQAEASLRALQALGFVKLVQIDGLLRYRLTDENDYANLPSSLQP